MNTKTKQAARDFLRRVEQRYDVADALLFGSQARADAHDTSDTDVAILLSGTPQSRVDIIIDMAGVAFEVMLDTGILVEALPIWISEWEHPEQFNNPALLANIRREGIRL